MTLSEDLRRKDVCCPHVAHGNGTEECSASSSLQPELQGLGLKQREEDRVGQGDAGSEPEQEPVRSRMEWLDRTTALPGGAASEDGNPGTPDHHGGGACCSDDGGADVGRSSPAPMVWPDTDSDRDCSGALPPLAMAATLWPLPPARGAEEDGIRPGTPTEGGCSHDGTLGSMGSLHARPHASGPAESEDAATEAAIYAAEEVLETAGHADLADRLFLWLASGQSKRVVATLFHLHYDSDLNPRQEKGRARFVRRIALLLGQQTPSLSGIGSSSNSCSGGLEGRSRCSSSSMDWTHAAFSAGALHFPGHS